jgi:hypothetical protein
MADLGHGQRWDNEAGPILSKETRTPLMVVVGLVERGHERTGVAEDHADAAPPAWSRSEYAKYLS